MGPWRNERQCTLSALQETTKRKCARAYQHREGFTRGGLTVCEDGAVVARQHICDERIAVNSKNERVEYKQASSPFTALGPVMSNSSDCGALGERMRSNENRGGSVEDVLFSSST